MLKSSDAYRMANLRLAQWICTLQFVTTCHVPRRQRNLHGPCVHSAQLYCLPLSRPRLGLSLGLRDRIAVAVNSFRDPCELQARGLRRVILGNYNSFFEVFPAAEAVLVQPWHLSTSLITPY